MILTILSFFSMLSNANVYKISNGKLFDCIDNKHFYLTTDFVEKIHTSNNISYYSKEIIHDNNCHMNSCKNSNYYWMANYYYLLQSKLMGYSMRISENWVYKIKQNLNSFNHILSCHSSSTVIDLILNIVFKFTNKTLQFFEIDINISSFFPFKNIRKKIINKIQNVLLQSLNNTFC